MRRWIFLLLLSGLISGCATSGSREPVRFRVMSYNIHHGEGVDRKIDLERIAGLIKHEQADLVALQEIDKGVERTARRDFPAELAALTGMRCLFVNNFHYQGGEYGNAILTRFPVERQTNLHYRMLRPAEQRGMLQTVVDVGGRKVVFVSTHLDFRREDVERLSNIEEMRPVFAAYRPLPIIVCGDFNDTPGSRTHAGMKSMFTDVWETVGEGPGFTITSTDPRKRIDYIFVSYPQVLKPLRAWVPRSEASDHLPLVAEFEMR